MAVFSQLPEPLESLTDEEINVLKEDYHLVLIADGYNEIPGQQTRMNLYELNNLDRYAGRVKLLISSREERDTRHFMPSGGSSLFRESVLSPFTAEQIVNYLEQYLTQSEDHTDPTPQWDVAGYQAELKALPALQALIALPFLLRITAEKLPTIVRDLEKTAVITPPAELTLKPAGRSELIQRRLYDQFAARWFQWQAAKALESKELLDNPKAWLDEEDLAAVRTAHHSLSGAKLAAAYLEQTYWRFCHSFAHHLQAEHRISVQYPPKIKRRGLFAKGKEKKEESPPEPTPSAWIAELLGTGADSRQVRQGCPLYESPDQEHQFIHASFIDYFVATIPVKQSEVTPAPVVVEESKKPGVDVEMALESTPDSPVGKVTATLPSLSSALDPPSEVVLAASPVRLLPPPAKSSSETEPLQSKSGGGKPCPCNLL